MNRCVPDFEMDDDYSISTSSAPNRPPRKQTMPEDDIMELLWQNGQIVVQSQNQNQRSTLNNRKSKDDAVLPDDGDSNRPAASQPQPTPQNPHLFIQEDEMANWLHYPIVDDPFCAELLYPDSITINHGSNTAATAELRQPQISAPAPKPPIHPPRRTELQNFLHFSRNNNSHRVAETAPSSSKSVVRETMTVVDSCESPLVGPSSRGLDSRIDGGGGLASATTSFATCATDNTSSATGATATASFLAKEVMACDMSLTSSPGGSSASASAEPMSFQKRPTAADRKRKGREAEDDAGFQSEDVELEYANGKKQASGSTSTKRSRAAEVHNLSERRRRDRINEKMKALQELIPRCNKSDKASMLDEAIEYLKSLQLQVQMMSMGCGMVPMMYPGVPPYMPMGMGMGMGMEMPGMNRPMMPYPNVLAGSTMPPAAAAHLGPRFPMQQFHMQPVPGNDPTRVQAANQSDPMLNSVGAQNPNQPRMPNFADPYQQYFSARQMQLPLQQNQSMAQSSTGNKPSSSRVPETHKNYQSGNCHYLFYFLDVNYIDHETGETDGKNCVLKVEVVGGWG